MGLGAKLKEATISGITSGITGGIGGIITGGLGLLGGLFKSKLEERKNLLSWD